MGVYDDIKVGLNQAIEQEQVNNIAKTLCQGYTNCTCNNRDGHCSTPQRDAKIIYEAGYRKEEDTIAEIQKRIKDVVNYSHLKLMFLKCELLIPYRCFAPVTYAYNGMAYKVRK